VRSLAAIALPVLVSSLALLPGGSARAQLASPLPASTPLTGLLDLTARGEVILLPAHDSSPFDAVIATRSRHGCDRIERTLLDVEGYPRVWPGLQEVRVVKRTKREIHYEFDIDMMFSPTLKGLVEHPARGVVVFRDQDTGGHAWYQLRDGPDGCQIVYTIHQPKGKRSGFVDLIRKLESGAGDMGELLGGIGTIRGLARPEQEVRRAPPVTRSAQLAWDQLASRGTVMRAIRRPGGRTALASKRVVSTPVADVLWAVRNRARYVKQVDAVKAVRDDGRTADWSISYFGGRVNVKTAIVEEGDVNSLEGLRITERVVGGDIRSGFWRWTIRAVEGGTEVELYYDADLARGSLVLRNFARQDRNLYIALPMHLSLKMMGDVVGGKPLRRRAPVAKAR
jgi:hypothetical protein